MSSHIREDALAAMLDGIISAFHSADRETALETHDPFNHCMGYAHAAFASLEASGFTIVWKGAHPTHQDWRERQLRPVPSPVE